MSGFRVDKFVSPERDEEAIRPADGTRIFVPVREQTRLRRALNVIPAWRVFQ